jgi:hypothetical protein
MESGSGRIAVFPHCGKKRPIFPHNGKNVSTVWKIGSNAAGKPPEFLISPVAQDGPA